MLPIYKMESWEIQTICTQILHLRERGRCANWTGYAETHCHCFRFHLTKHSHFSQLRTLYTKAYLALCTILTPSKNYWNPRPFQGQSSVLEPSSLWRFPLKFFLIKSTGAADVDMLWMIPWWWWVTGVAIMNPVMQPIFPFFSQFNLWCLPLLLTYFCMSIIMFEAFLSVYFLTATASVHHGRRRKFTAFYMQHLSIYQNYIQFLYCLGRAKSRAG